MEYELQQKSDVAILSLRGEVDVSQATVLRDKLLEIINQGNGRLLVDMSQVEYIDSSGLSVLVAAHRKCQGKGGMMGLVNPQKPVQQVFQLTRMDKLFNVYPTVEAGETAVTGS